MKRVFSWGAIVLFLSFSQASLGSTEGSIRGQVTDTQQVGVFNARVKVISSAGKLVKQTVSSATGDFSLFPIEFGDYTVQVDAPGLGSYSSQVHVNSGAVTEVNARLAPSEMVVKVTGKKRAKIQASESRSSINITKEEIADLPQGDTVKLPKLITSTTPGVVSGAFGQMFFRGNHASIQYQIDGVQLPDSPSNTFGEALTPRNIDHMEIITGGIPAEYGERLAAVINIVSKSGPETPGGSAEVNYGTYNTFSPTVTVGGSSATGNLHYFVSANYNRTDRGLDTPEPISSSNVQTGGSDVIHDTSSGNNEFLKLDWLPDNSNKLTFIVFNSMSNFQIPNYPSSFASSPLFVNGDSYGNPPYNYLPPNTNDTQTNQDTYAEVVWKHTFSDRTFLQVAPFFKYSKVVVNNDPTNDLAGASIAGPNPPVYASFYENRPVNNIGLKTDFTWRPNDSHLVKTGILLQTSNASGSYSIQTAQNGATLPYDTVPYVNSTPNYGYFESIYAQDDFTILKGRRFIDSLVLNAGLRFDATQFILGGGANPTDSSLQPRIGLSYSPWPSTKIHAFYGRLFQPAPLQNLQAAFVATGGGQATPYNIQAEKADFYEVGIAHEFEKINQVVSLTYYRKNAQNLLDDSELFNTAIAQPVNFSDGFVYGTEVSIRGQITEELSNYLNYSYSIAQGEGLSGGLFTLPVGQSVTPGYQYLDHAQMHTLNAGLTFKRKNYWVTLQGFYGSGLRTGDNNSLELPHHFTMDATVGYEFHGAKWWNSGVKVSMDILNMWNNQYPISVANGFNGSHYAAGRFLYFHLVKEF